MDGKSNDEYKDEEDLNIFNEMEMNFLRTVQELVGDHTLDKFRQEYEKLNDALVESHKKNGILIDQCRQMHQGIQMNANKISTVLSLSQSDNKTISLLRSEFERAWKMVEFSKMRETKSRDVIYSLQEEIANLKLLIQQSETEDFKKSAMQKATSYVETLRKEIKTNKMSINDIINEIDETKKFTATITNIVRQLEEDESSEVCAMNRLEEELKILGKQKISTVEEQERRIEEMVNQRNAVISVRKQKEEKRKKIEEMKLELRNCDRMMSGIRDNTSASQRRSELKKNDLRKFQKITDLNQREFDIYKEKFDKCGERLEEAQKMQQIVTKEYHQNYEIYQKEKSIRANLNFEHKNVVKQHSNLETNVFQLKNKLTASDLQIRADRNDTSTTGLELRDIISKSNQETVETEIAIKSTEVATRDCTNAKGFSSIQRSTEFRMNADLESTLKKQNDFENSTILVNFANRENQDRLDNLSINLSKFGDDILKQDQLMDIIKNDKIILCRAFEKTRVNSAKITDDCISLDVEVRQLKSDIRYCDQQLIDAHFETKQTYEEIEETEKELEEMKSKLKNLYNEDEKVLENIQKDTAVITEAEKDMLATELFNEDISRQNRHIEKTLTRKRIESMKMFEKCRVVKSELRMAEKIYQQKISDVESMKYDLEKNVVLFNELLFKAKRNDLVYNETLRLEKSLVEFESKFKVLENESETPRLLHRWTLLESVNPELMRLIHIHNNLVDIIWLKMNEMEKLKIKRSEISQKLSKETKLLQGLNKNNGNISNSIKKQLKLLQQKEENLGIVRQKLSQKMPQVEYENQLISSARSQIRKTKENTAQFPTASSVAFRSNEVKEPTICSEKRSPGRFIGGGFAVGAAKITRPFLDLAKMSSRKKLPIMMPLTDRKIIMPQRKCLTQKNKTRTLRSARLPIDDL